MIRNLKVLLGAALVLAAFGALSASGAQAHTPAQFHCAVEPCEATLEPDGTSGQATAHHVFVIKNGNGETVSITCDTLTGHATSSSKTPTEIEFTNLVYSGCRAGADATGSATVDMNGCKYNFTAAGTVTITGCEVVGGVTKAIEVTLPGAGKCIATVAQQGPLAGIKYHNEGAAGKTPATTLVTAEAKVPGIAVTLHGECPIPKVAPITSEYTTGNTIVRGYKDGLTHNETNRVDLWWTATVA